ncbi:hypothetical protein J1N35_005214 [Gossypium stocksii]|uniref:Uncharacterized protein n=1 Tax=Gossypium stocksii TaxID=47602 RepID=A0A9D3WCG1_9ROSI|nr:hypothetical protein J1N35_005214 [Gossypium stocksii]
MPRKRTHASAQIDETQNKFHYEEAKVRYESIFKNQQTHPEKDFTLKQNTYTDITARICQVSETLNLDLFCEKRPSVDEELVHEFYANLTSTKMTKVPFRGIKQFEPKNLKEILEELTVPGSKWTVSKQGIHTCRREYLIPLAKQRVEESEDPEEEEEDPIEIEPVQEVEVRSEVEPMEPEAKLDVKNLMSKTQSPRPNLRDELSKLMEIM